MTKTTAPLYHTTECCGTCMHRTDYRVSDMGGAYDMGSYKCQIHKADYYGNGMNFSLTVENNNICADFKWKPDRKLI